MALAVSRTVKMIKLALAPAWVSQKSQFFRLTTMGRIAFSTWLLLISISPWSRNAQRYSRWFREQVMAFFRLPDGRKMVSSQV